MVQSEISAFVYRYVLLLQYYSHSIFLLFVRDTVAAPQYVLPYTLAVPLA